MYTVLIHISCNNYFSLVKFSRGVIKYPKYNYVIFMHLKKNMGIINHSINNQKNNKS